MRARRSLVTALAVAAMVAGTWTASPAQAAEPAPLIGITAPASVPQGQAFTLIGAIRRPTMSNRLVLQTSRDGVAFTNAGSYRTDAGGNLKVPVTASATTTYRWFFYADGVYDAAVSDAVRVLVTPKPAPLVGVGVSPSFTHQGLTLTLTGALRNPAFASRLVLQSSADTKAWKNVRSVTTDRGGNVKTSLTASSTLSYRWYYAGDGTHAAAVSGSLRPVVHPKLYSYKNCDALHVHYPHGVGKPGSVDKKSTSGAPVTTWLPSSLEYAKVDGNGAGENDLDRDNDGIACEKA